MGEKISLFGFNNLTKALSFNIYDICYARSLQEKNEYIRYIDEQYNSECLAGILRDVAETIGAQILSISKQDYDPQGASVNMLIANIPSAGQGVHAHLDKSHITVHTFPESHPDSDISTFRADIDVVTCGEISPLKAMNFLIGCFDSDIVIIDYRIRGFTRDISGRKYFLDHNITSIQDYIDESIRKRYDAVDVNVSKSNIFHTKMILREIDLQRYLFQRDVKELSDREQETATKELWNEMIEICSGTNIC